MKFFSLTEATFVGCRPCEQHLVLVTSEPRTAVDIARAVYCMSDSLCVSPMQALNLYFEAFHVSGHVDLGPPEIDPDMRMAKLYDEGPDKLHVTDEMLRDLIEGGSNGA